MARKFMFVRTLVFYAEDEDSAWQQLEEHLNEERNDYSYTDSWAIDPLPIDTELS